MPLGGWPGLLAMCPRGGTIIGGTIIIEVITCGRMPGATASITHPGQDMGSSFSPEDRDRYLLHDWTERSARSVR